MRYDQPVKTYWAYPSPGTRWLCKQYFDKRIILLDEEDALRELSMGVDLEVDKLTNNLTDQVDKLTKRVAEVNEKLSGAFKDTHDTVDIVSNQADKILSVTAKLKAIVGGQTNNPPPEDLLT